MNNSIFFYVLIILAVGLAYVVIGRTLGHVNRWIQPWLQQRRMRRILAGDVVLCTRVGMQQQMLKETEKWEELPEHVQEFLLRSFSYSIVAYTKYGWPRRHLDHLVGWLSESPDLWDHIEKAMDNAEVLELQR